MKYIHKKHKTEVEAVLIPSHPSQYFVKHKSGTTEMLPHDLFHIRYKKKEEYNSTYLPVI